MWRWTTIDPDAGDPFLLLRRAAAPFTATVLNPCMNNRDRDDEMAPREKQVIDDRIDQLTDPDKHYSTEKAAAELGILLDD